MKMYFDHTSRKADVESEFVNDSRNASQDEVSTEVVAYPEEGRSTYAPTVQIKAAIIY